MLTVVESGENENGIPVVKEIPRVRELLLAIANGSTMREACKAIGLSPFTFWRLRTRNPDLDCAYEAAVAMAREAVAQQCLAIARATSYESVSADRLLIETLKWQAGRVLGGFTAANSRAGATINIDQRSVHVGEAIAEVAGRRKAIQ